MSSLLESKPFSAKVLAKRDALLADSSLISKKRKRISTIQLLLLREEEQQCREEIEMLTASIDATRLFLDQAPSSRAKVLSHTALMLVSCICVAMMSFVLRLLVDFCFVRVQLMKHLFWRSSLCWKKETLRWPIELKKLIIM